MVRRGAAVLAAGICLSACCLFPAQQEFACPGVKKASAWVNRMPGPGRSSANFHIALRLDDAQSWMLSPETSGEAGVMTLSLMPGGPAVAGTAGYRQAVPDPLPDEIRIQCHGKTVAIIDDVTIAR